MDPPTDKKYKDFDETYPLCSFALALGFIYPNRTNLNKRAIVITIIIILNGAQIFWFITYTYKCLSTLDIYNFARNMTLAVVLVLFLIKTYYAIFCAHKFAPLLRNMSRDIMRANNLDEDYQEIYDELIRQGKVAEKLWLILPMILSAQFPIYVGICMSIESIQTDDFTRLMVHDMDLMFVEDIQSETPFFQCMFAYNCVQCVILVPNYCGFDGSFCIATTHLRMKLKLMTHKVRKAFNDTRNECELKELMKQAIKDHQAALDFHAQIQDVYGTWLLAIFFLTSFLISFNLYQIYLLGHIDVKYTIFGIFSVLHIYLPCHYASVLCKAGEDVSSELYCVPWEVIGNASVTKTLIFMIARSQKELILTGNGFVIFNMELFKSILQTSYSFFTLITS